MSRQAMFYGRVALFNMREEFSGLSNAIGILLLYPFFIWLMAQMWSRFSGTHGQFPIEDLYAYVGLTEVLQMTLLSMASLRDASGDFSLSLARPRSWPLTSLCAISGRTFATRLAYLGAFLVILPILTQGFAMPLRAAARFLMFLPVLTLIDGLLVLLLASAKIIFDKITYFRLPFTKLFMIFGGMIAPLSEMAEPWRGFFLSLPFSDLMFQPAYFALRGEFFELTTQAWCLRIALLIAILAALNAIVFNWARKHHNSFGG